MGIRHRKGVAMYGEGTFIRWVETEFGDGYQLDLANAAVAYAAETDRFNPARAAVRYLEEEIVALEAMVKRARVILGNPWPQASNPGTMPRHIISDMHE
jgi:hypothetical protein